MRSLLDFEQPLLELNQYAAQLKAFAEIHPELDLTKAITALDENTKDLTRQAFQKVSRWDKVWLSRHAERPQAPVYIEAMLEDPIELRGDRLYADDRALIGGFAWFDGQPIVYLAQQKGTNIKERQEMNFGYTRPGGIPQGTTFDAARGKIQSSANLFCRHAWGTLRCGIGGTRTVDSDC